MQRCCMRGFGVWDARVQGFRFSGFDILRRSLLQIPALGFRHKCLGLWFRGFGC